MTDDFFRAMEQIVEVITVEQRHDSMSPYSFQRFNCPPSDTLTRQGRALR